MKDVNGKYIWIIGASSGIGAALAKELAANGAHLIISARRKEKLEELAAALPGEGHMIAPLDVSDAKEIEKAQGTILQTAPRIDSAIFLAAIYKPHDGAKKPLSFIQNAIDVNVMGAFNLVDVVQSQYEKQGQGQIVLCASVAGYRGLPTGQPYCATKAALINLAESLKIDLESKNIDVKVICPGFVKTPLTDKNDFPMPMIIEAEDAAKAIRKGLCSRSFEIHFPKRFTFIMKLLRILPHGLYFAIARKMRS
ncbi:MAG: SDR family NAD(P)-dependent oxidoreductase [Alphaproteobacteria bacterium]